MDILGKLFGSQARVRLMRLLLANRSGLPKTELEQKSRLNKKVIRKELKLLESIGLLRIKKTVVNLRTDFPYLGPLRDLLVAFPEKQDLCKKISKFGKIKLLLITGNLTGNLEAPADLLVVGDRLKKKGLEKAIQDLEVSLGRAINFALMDTQEFLYRYSMYDKFVRDVLEFGHEKLICAPELSTLVGNQNI